MPRAYIYLNRKCNLRCVFCASDDTNKVVCPDEHVDIIKDFIHECAMREKCDSLIISGGEPTLHQNLIEIVEYASGFFHVIQLMTNGLSFDDAEYMRRLLSCGVSSVCIPISSPVAEIFDEMSGVSGSYSLLQMGLNNLFKYKRENPFFTITMKTITMASVLDSFQYFPEYLRENHFLPDFFVINGLHVGEKVLKRQGLIPQLQYAGERVSKLITSLKNIQTTISVSEFPLCLLSLEALEITIKNRCPMSASMETCILDNGKVEFWATRRIKSYICQSNCLAYNLCDGLPGKNFDAQNINIDEIVRPIVFG